MVDFIVKRKKIRSETCSRVSLTGCDTTRHDTTRRDTTRNARVSVPLSSDARGEEKGGGKKIRGKRVNEAKRRGGRGEARKWSAARVKMHHTATNRERGRWMVSPAFVSTNFTLQSRINRRTVSIARCTWIVIHALRHHLPFSSS